MYVRSLIELLDAAWQRDLIAIGIPSSTWSDDAKISPDHVQESKRSLVCAQQPSLHPSNMPDNRHRSMLARVADELGFITLLHARSDVFLLLCTRFIRMLAYGASSLVLALYLAELGHSDVMIGVFMTLTLAGDVLLSLCLTFVADRAGRRRILMLGGLLMTSSGVIFALCSNYWILLMAAVVGVISSSGNEIGPFRAVEESTLAHLIEPPRRSDIFAFYVVVGTLGGAAGSIIGGWTTQALSQSGSDKINAYSSMFWLYAAIGLFKVILTLCLSAECEVHQTPEQDDRRPLLGEQNSTLRPSSPSKSKKTTNMSKSRLSKETALLLLRLCTLFFFDSLGSGMMPNSLIAYFIWRKFGLLQGKLGNIIAMAQFVSSIGNLFASTLSKRIGPVKTMVCTHLPSAVFLAMIPLPASLLLTVVLIVARSSLSSMDQAPRSVFLSAIVKSHERTAVMGIVNTSKTLSQSLGPVITGLLADHGDFWIAFIVAGSVKILYDIGFLAMFLNAKLQDDSNGDGSEPDPRVGIDSTTSTTNEMRNDTHGDSIERHV